MALIDVACLSEACGKVSEVYRAVKDWPATPPCPQCGAQTEQTHRPKTVQWTVDPVVVYQAGDGSFRFPGDRGALSAHEYERKGFHRIEIRSAVEMRRFEGMMNKRDFSLSQRRVERELQQREQREAVTRSELRRRMQSMSPYGRALAQAVIDRNNHKPKKRASESGFHSEVYSHDRSNRDESRDSQGRRRRD